jgi:hypothetical protein
LPNLIQDFSSVALQFCHGADVVYQFHPHNIAQDSMPLIALNERQTPWGSPGAFSQSRVRPPALTYGNPESVN